MRADVVYRSQEFLLLFQRIYFGPILDRPHYRWIRPPAVPTHDLPHQLGLNLGQGELRNPETHRENCSSIECAAY